MPKKKKRVSSKNSVNLIVLALLALVIFIGALALQRSNGFSLLPQAATISGSSKMCQQPCVVNYQCGLNQICAQKPNSIDRKKYCYNPSCPNNYQCGGEGCGGECRLIKDKENDFTEYSTLEECQKICKSKPSKTCLLWKYGDAGEKYVCNQNTSCRHDSFGFSAYLGGRASGYWKNFNNYNSTCPINWNGRESHGGTECIDWLRCDELIENGKIVGIKVTTTEDNTDLAGIWVHARCVCNERGFCERGDFREIRNIDKNMSVICRFDTGKCEGPFGP